MAGAAPCVQWIAAEKRRCGDIPTRVYLQGPKCAAHTPAALAGEPEPGQDAYCAPARCYCGSTSCPAYSTYELRDRYAEQLSAWTTVDARVIARGSRRSRSPEQYAAARAAVEEQKRRKAGGR